ncbi:PREDICTED: protein HEXIM1-like [Diuraphis noxia]|uniref:protein HEXIM1-like n=1 Tax=Diuraphis noxia TaxID=143948 RepID=UPI000763A36E|nr:PREDICTED: protein HEXIM1-like [Diuraphis noxia]
MEEDQNGVVAAAVVGRPPNSETCGMIVNHSGGEEGPTPTAAAAAPPTPALPAAAAATAFGAPARPAPRYGAHLNFNNNNSVIKGQLNKGPGNLDHRNRRTRRGKRKSRKQTPYMKDGMLYRDKAVAPNNTNQFLMDDHNDGPDIDKKLLARYSNENGRTRNSSYTSVESEGEQMYSSSDDDGTSIQKEFIDTYRLIQEEQLSGLTPSELVQRVIELEEKLQTQQESKRFKKNMITYSNGIPKEEDEDNFIDIEEYRSLQVQNRELMTQNKLLQAEIETLKQIQSKTINNDSDSSVDSESSSDSSSSSSSSDGQEIEMKFLVRSSERND